MWLRYVIYVIELHSYGVLIIHRNVTLSLSSALHSYCVLSIVLHTQKYHHSCSVLIIHRNIHRSYCMTCDQAWSTMSEYRRAIRVKRSERLNELNRLDAKRRQAIRFAEMENDIATIERLNKEQVWYDVYVMWCVLYALCGVVMWCIVFCMRCVMYCDVWCVVWCDVLWCIAMWCMCVTMFYLMIHEMKTMVYLMFYLMIHVIGGIKADKSSWGVG